jgi:DNA polymerase-3 subunit delta'
MSDGTNGGTVWDAVVGQPAALARLQGSLVAPVHAYLFVGPPGSTKLEAARAFAAALLYPDGDVSGRDVRLVLNGEHPDVKEISRVGAAISAEQADEIVRLAAMSPREGSRKVLILDEFHLLRAEGAAKLLKTIEEPTPSTTFLVLADQVPPELVTIASRCVRIDFRPVPVADVEAALLADGIEPEAARRAAESSNGDLDRAHVLARDPEVVKRREAFASVPQRLDGTGSAVAKVVDDLQALIESAAAPLAARQAEEIKALDERVAATGERGSGRSQMTERHKRELRRHRTDELRAGLGVLAAAYRDALVEGRGHRPGAYVEAVHNVHDAIEALERNPNETLLLQNLLLHLPA